MSHSLDHRNFLQVVGESLQIKRHADYFFWLQGEFQQFVPHEIMIGAWGDFESGEVMLDVVSALPGVRTQSLSACAAEPEACPVRLLMQGLFSRWLEHDRHGYRLTAASGLTAAAPDCNCDIARHLRRMRSAQVHGMGDQRSGCDCLYVALSPDDQALPVTAAYQLLLPYVDAALRRVCHLPSQSRGAAGIEPGDGDLGGDHGLSERESEIIRWVRLGKTNYEIGIILGISAFTVKNHLQRIFRKLDVSNRAQAAAKVDSIPA